TLSQEEWRRWAAAAGGDPENRVRSGRECPSRQPPEVAMKPTKRMRKRARRMFADFWRAVRYVAQRPEGTATLGEAADPAGATVLEREADNPLDKHVAAPPAPESPPNPVRGNGHLGVPSPIKIDIDPPRWSPSHQPSGWPASPVDAFYGLVG